MPRKRPVQLRPRSTPASRQAEARGLAAVTAEALERLDLPGLDPLSVADELQTWRRLVHLSASTLSAPHNDWAEFIGPMTRGVLEEADRVLNRRDGGPLRAELARLDAEFERKTRPNPFADPDLPWWARRWTH